MKIKFIKASNYLIGLLLTTIGFSSCSKDNKGNQMLMYGTPTAEYQISGRVSDSDNDPIEGISVSVFSREISEAITDEDGNYKLDTVTSGFGNLELSIEDIDGVKNGEFKTKKKVETFDKSDFKGGEGAWYLGKATRTVNIKLTEKTTPEE